MPGLQLIDCEGQRRATTRRATNLQQALCEATTINSELQTAIVASQLSAMQAWDASDTIAAAIASAERLIAQLRFAEGLAEKALA